MIERARVAEPRHLPRHVAIIMDGNRRWAAERNLAAVDGHRAGADALRDIACAAAHAGLAYLTVHAFAEDRHAGALAAEPLARVVAGFARREAAALAAANVRVRPLGRTEALPAFARDALDALVAATAGNDGLHFNLALNYGARDELCDAVRALAREVKAGRLARESIDDDALSRYLYTAGMPDPDLLIRTGGELRVSNFLLYQIAYAELWATPVAWPDFRAAHLEAALAEFSTRQRRFGS